MELDCDSVLSADGAAALVSFDIQTALETMDNSCNHLNELGHIQIFFSKLVDFTPSFSLCLSLYLMKSDHTSCLCWYLSVDTPSQSTLKP